MPSSSKFPATDPKILLQRIHDAFPDIRWTSYTYIDEGWDHEIIMLDDKLVFRFPNDEEYAGSLKDEVLTLKRLVPLVPLPIPRYTYVAPKYQFAGYPLLPGRQLQKKYFDGLPAADRTGLARQLADFLSAIHTLIQHGYDFGSVMVSTMPEDQKELKEQTKQYLSDVLNDEDYVLTQTILADVDAVLAQPLPTVLLHGDIYYNHLLWDTTTKQLGIIDFSDMNRGDPAFDFAELYEYGEDFVREVHAYYTGPKDDTLLVRAWAYQRWVSIFMMVDHFLHHKTTFKKARETFDRIKAQQSEFV